LDNKAKLQYLGMIAYGLESQLPVCYPKL